MSRRSEVRDPVEAIRDTLARGVTGCLQVDDERGSWRIYVMQGEILAAHGPDDGAGIVRRLLNSDSISPRQADALEAALARGETIEALLVGRVPHDLFVELLAQRFRQNILDFICTDATPVFTAMEAVFVENIQTGHDSIELLDSVVALRQRILPLRDAAAGTVIEPGVGVPRSQVHARLLDLADTRRSLASLLRLSPYEDGVTLAAVADMLEQGLLRQVHDPDAGAVSGHSEPELVPEARVPRNAGPGASSRPGRDSGGGLDDASEADRTLQPPGLDGGGSMPVRPDDVTQDVMPSALDDAEGSLLDLHSDLIQPIGDSLVEDLEGTPDLSAFFGATVDDEAAPPRGAAPSGDDRRTGPEEGSPSNASTAAPLDEDSDPAVAMAIRRAREIEQRRAAAQQQDPGDASGVVQRPPGFDWDVPVDEEELAFFADQDNVRGGGKGLFTSESHLLDVVDLSAENLAALDNAGRLAQQQLASQEAVIEMAEATPEEAAGAVALSFTGPELDEQDMMRKIEVVNDVLAKVAAAIDDSRGRGAGAVSLQLVVDGTPARFAPLFRGVRVDPEGRMNPARLVRNLRKRPQSEHRRLLNDGMLDLIQRCLSASLEELDEDRIDAMLESIAGYQQRLGL